MKGILWHAHAKERLTHRNIDRGLVLRAIEKPDQIIVSGKRRVVHKRYHDDRSRKEYLLRIFLEEHQQMTVVLSVYRTSKINKYWREER